MVPEHAVLSATVNASSPLHPYYPLGVVIPSYVTNSLSTPALLAIFATGCAAILLPTYLLIQTKRPGVSNTETAIALWFILCGFIHFFFEGYFAYNAHHLGSLGHIFAQLWKEYSLSDSRYLTQDSFVVCMETITAIFWGPLSFLCAYCVVADHPLRHWLQTVVSLGQLYGDVLYFATCSFDQLVAELVHCRPELAYFWCYYVLMNAFWIVIPLALLVQSGRETTRAFALVQAMKRSGKKNL
ncbi:uncharacterized protein K452DRAFT_267682 [Aplosporella prunicola CBS 121167]|uniref:EXPERA domain-containing protein n=1 Tax=Aplosporella prunicola CBS 121167 TaxID=1176127 RepID=A0A6A6BLX0_9PEZI|nr:uncharacterized protein K452DRAFT_267682 [Aplosporella prunicola CBS 121167]KAF2143541.1 hypothetical protein K452DRAFT_267682 [Aplosporella prunicola CBS 121167]